MARVEIRWRRGAVQKKQQTSLQLERHEYFLNTSQAKSQLTNVALTFPHHSVLCHHHGDDKPTQWLDLHVFIVPS